MIILIDSRSGYKTKKLIPNYIYLTVTLIRHNQWKSLNMIQPLEYSYNST